MIISLSGYAFVGKDTVANALVEHRGFVKYAWADTLRLAAAALNPIVHVEPDGKILRYNDVIESVGYNEAKVLYPETRTILQRLGTEVGRNLIGGNVWVESTIRRINKDRPLTNRIVITDTRFPNEADAVKRMSPDNLVVRVHRDGVLAQSDHPSETSMDGWSYDDHIYNDGTIEEIADSVVKWFDSQKISR